MENCRPIRYRGARTRFRGLAVSRLCSANGTSDRILWTLEHRDRRSPRGAGVLHAYDALDLTKELYNSDQYGTQDVPGLSVKFTVPTIINGKVYIGTQQELDVYGSVPGLPRPTPTPRPRPLRPRHPLQQHCLRLADQSQFRPRGDGQHQSCQEGHADQSGIRVIPLYDPGDQRRQRGRLCDC